MNFIKKLVLGYTVVKDLVASEGFIKFVSKFIGRFFEFLFFQLFKKSEFEFKNHKYRYFYSLFNVTFTNERSVEIPIVLDFVKTSLNREILEIGNVLHWYFEFKHDVVDKYEKGQGIINQDVVEYRTSKNMI